MNNPLNIQNGAGLLKNLYAKGKKPQTQPGPIAQMSQNMPMMAALRKKRDLIGKTQTMGK